MWVCRIIKYKYRKDHNMKDIKNYEGLYAVTSCGKIWSYKRQKFLKPFKSNFGYLLVALSKNGLSKNYSVHRLVAQAYLDNPDNLPEVNHKDECKTNNYVSNLEWCSRKYNANYGNRAVKAAEKLSKTIYCVELDKTFNSIADANRALNLSKSCVTNCLKGHSKTAGGFHWQYV